MTRLRKMWRDLMTPDAFKNSWYGALTNQGMHTFIGALASGLFCMLWYAATEELPVRALVFMACFLPYPLLIEWAAQGWRKGDSWFDSLMYGCGVLGPLVALRDVSTSGPPVIIPQPGPFLALVAVWAAVLGNHVWRRAVREYDAE